MDIPYVRRGRAYVLEQGRIVLEGSGDELLDQDLIKKAHLGL